MKSLEELPLGETAGLYRSSPRCFDFAETAKNELFLLSSQHRSQLTAG
jgi:hypothetical protein